MIKFIKLLLLLLLLFVIFLASNNNYKVRCFPLSYPSFPDRIRGDFIVSNDSNIAIDALQVTEEARGASINHKAGRILYKKRFRLWDKKGKIASFNSTFVLNILNQTSHGGEGLAFVLTKDSMVPPDSDGQWLGIVNSVTNGSDKTHIVAVEFDTKKSFPQDLDHNHVGLDINSVYSKAQVSLNGSNITIADGNDITAMILYDGNAKSMNVFVFNGSRIGPNPVIPIMSVSLDLTVYLPSKVYVGFSASTGSETELNCVKEWYFNGDKIDPGMPLWVWVVIPLIILLVFFLLLGGYYAYWRKKRNKSGHVSSMDDPTIRGIETGLGPKKIKLKDLKAATGNFDAKNELGRGGFGIVYHGIWEGDEVAVKRIINTSQGKQNLVAEVTTIGSLHHKNLVKLIGWCYESNELLLVYEYMPNNSLDKLIYTNYNEKCEMSSILTWERRHTIICGVAQALDYLHNECLRRVLHRDIKASNIMLDSEFNARLGDFGLARMFKLSERSHHSTKEIAGTLGYMAPEIFHTGRTTAETDVFAFGVLTLVVACGRKPALQKDEERENVNSIIDWVWEQYKLEVVMDAMDPKLRGKFDKGQAECMLVLGLACCHPNPYVRPSMRTALQVLMGEALPPLVPLEKPAFIWPATAPSFTRDGFLSGGMLTPLTLSGR